MPERRSMEEGAVEFDDIYDVSPVLQTKTSR